jgi:nitroimidazol reductase NimA-like FMN-containing flavoprotein (pyridoxamine 5'-phosphate oxidase superfamily)
VGFAIAEQPYVIPIDFARVKDDLILHGARASRLLKHIEAGTPVRDELLIQDIPIPQYVTHYARR